jgi:hypothetical protein
MTLRNRVLEAKINHMFPAGIEPATSPVWRVRDNHYTKETVIDEVEIPGKIETIFLYVDQRNTLKRQLGLVAQRITRLTTDQKIAGSNPAEIDNFFLLVPQMENEMSKGFLRPRVGSNHQPFG